MLKVAAFTGGQNVPSARFRVRQLIPGLEKERVHLQEYISAFGAYPPASKWVRPSWAIATLGDRIPSIVGSYQFDVTLLQREFLSTYRTIEPFTKRPRVLDVDDAIWLNGSGKFAGRLAQSCEMVICGNSYLANYFQQWNKNIVIIPTPVDTARFTPGAVRLADDHPIIGWTGSSANFAYLFAIEAALAQTMKSFPQSKLRIVSDRRPTFTQIPLDKVEYIRWTPENEVNTIQGMSLGIMPLDDSEWVRGKCSYKMLLYMACGIPVVVHPVGMNTEILSLGKVGLGASSKEDWIEALSYLLYHPEERLMIGKTGRQIVQRNFGLEVIAPQLADSLKSLVVKKRIKGDKDVATA